MEEIKKRIVDAENGMTLEDGKYIPMWKRIEGKFSGEVIPMKVDFPDDTDTMIERVNPWSSARIRGPAEALYTKWKNHETKNDERVRDWNLFTQEMNELIKMASVEFDEENNPLIAGIRATPNFGEGNPQFTDIVFLNDELKKSDLNNESFAHDNSFYARAKSELVSKGVSSNRMFSMTIVPIHTNKKNNEDAVKKVFWPLMLVRLRILRPRYVIALSAAASQPVFEKFNTEAKVETVRKNIEYPVDIGRCSFTLIRLASSFEMSKTEFSSTDRKSFQEQLYQIAQVLNPNKEPEKRKAGINAFSAMMNAAKKPKTAQNNLQKSDLSSTWELDNRIHVSGDLNPVAQESLMRNGVALFVNVESISASEHIRKKYGAENFRIEMEKMTADRFTELLGKVQKVFENNKRVAIHAKNRSRGAAILASLMVAIEGVSKKEAAERAAKSRHTILSESELFPK